jgi:hypothetical protein
MKRFSFIECECTICYCIYRTGATAIERMIGFKLLNALSCVAELANDLAPPTAIFDQVRHESLSNVKRSYFLEYEVMTNPENDPFGVDPAEKTNEPSDERRW